MACLIVSSLVAQKKDDKKWDVNNPPGKYKEVAFTVNEGTWMNLDVSPDGSEIVFDLLGDIYIMPITGGQAKPLRTGLAFEVQPRFSPDGKRILFTSDVAGGDNIWSMNRDGSDAKQITKESFRLLNNGIWMPEGDYIIARKHFTSTRSAGAGEMWMYHVSGGSGVQLTKRKNEQQDVNEPSISLDGRYLYYSEDMYPGGYFQYNKDPNDQIYAIFRYDTETGKTTQVTGGPGGACRPQVSPDGKQLAFVRRVRTKSVLFIHDLETGREYPIFDGLGKDQQEAWAIFGAYTGFNWTPNGKNIVVWGQGKLWNVNIAAAKATEIPFTVNVKQQVAETIRFKQDPDPDQFDANVIRQAVTSPNGKLLVFNAAGYLYSKELPNGTPKRLTKQTDHFEFEPSFSPDGSTIVYVSWNDEEYGAIRSISARGGSSKVLTQKPAIYREPSYSPDGSMLVFRKENGNQHQGYMYSKNTGLYTMPARGGVAKHLEVGGGTPRFDKTGKRIFYATGWGMKKNVKSVDLNGQDERIHISAKYGKRFMPSHDNKWVAFTDLHKVYIATMPLVGQTLNLSADTKSFPVAQVAKDAGINLHWSADNKKLHWTLGDELFTAELNDFFLFLEGAVDTIPALELKGQPINLKLKTDRPEGIIAFTNARVITVDQSDKVLENHTVIVEGNRIKTIAPSSEIKLPKGAFVLDCTGKTLMPGLVDVHAHLGTFRQGLSPQKQWSYYANLAYGVTSTHDPSSNSEMTLSQSEAVRSGSMVGPRVFTTGRILYGADGDFKAPINSLEDAQSAVRRTKAYGAFSVKSYNQPRRDQRQQVIEASRREEIMVYPEGGSHFLHNMSMILDGHTSIEHNIPVAPLFDDVISLWGKTKTVNTPTLVVNYGGVNGEYYWYQNTNVWEKERLLTFTPRSIVDSRSRHRTMIPDEEYENGHILVSKSLKKLTDAGVKVNLGSHGQLQGLAAHWELWMFGQGGMTNAEVIRAGTINGAYSIGMDQDLGSIEVGKLADIIVLEKNPMTDIRNTEYVDYTMINGRLYDASTLNEIGNSTNTRSKFYWELDGYNPAFKFHQTSGSFMQPNCECRARP